MELTRTQLAKTNDPLARALGAVAPHDTLRVVLVLHPPAHHSAPPQPANFPTREEFRQALIDWNASAQPVGLIDRLRGFGLDPRGGELGAVVVHGTAEHILKAIDQPEVQHALSDATISIPPPRRPSSAAG